MNILKLFLAAALFVPALSAQAKTCELSINANDMIQYNTSELHVGADCDTVTLTLNHTGMLPVTQMGHNWVLAETAVWKEVALDGLAAGQDNDYLEPGDERVLAHTDLIGGGESTSVTVDLAGLDRGRDYTFFCSFPGHYVQMNGTFILSGDS